MSAPKRVAYILKRYPRFSETFIVNEILALERQGVEVEIFAFKPATEGCFHRNLAQVRASVTYLSTAGQKVQQFQEVLRRAADELPILKHVLPMLLAQESDSLEMALRIALQLRERPPEVIHAHFASKAATVAMLVSALIDVPFTLTAHAKDIYHEGVDSVLLAQKLQAAAAVVTVSNFNVNYLETEFPNSRATTHRIYNGLNLTELIYAVPTQLQPHLVAVGRLVEKKGFETLLQAVSILRETQPELRCDLVGDGPLRGLLEALVDRLELRSHVTFHGVRPQHEVHELIQNASVFAAPCVVSADGDRDGLPTVLLESMALGTPVVSTAVTGIPEIITDGQSGLIVPQHDPLALARACASILNSGGLAIQLSRRARTLIEDSFDIDVNSKTLLSLWGKVVQQALAS